MALIRRSQNSFVAGKLDKTMAARSDMGAYEHGCETLTNFRPLLLGGITRRPGTQYKATANGDGRFARFVFNDDQQYIFLFRNLVVEIYTSDGTLIQTLVSPWTTAVIPEIRYSQSGDTMIVVQEDFEQQKIIRTGATTFTIGPMTFEENTAGFPMYQPYHNFSPDGTTVQPSATTGVGITITASAPIFEAAYVGLIIRIGQKEIEITGYTSTTILVGTVRETLASNGATAEWDEPAFSSMRGYPRSVVFHDDRLCLGGSRDLPDTLFASNIAAFFKFDLGDQLDDDAIQATIGVDSVAKINHLVSSDNLQVFTDTTEFFVPTSDTKPFVPDNMSFKRQRRFGSNNIPPVTLEGETMYFDKSGKHLREFAFSDIEQHFNSNSLTKLSPSILVTPVSVVAIANSPNHEEQYAYVVNSDGTVALLHSLREEEVTAWALWTTDGLVKSVTSIEDEIFFLVERTINGATVYYIEMLKFGWTLDCAINLTSAATTSWSGLSHLEAKSAEVVSSTFHEGTYTVASGAITTDTEQTDIIVGLNYTPVLKDMPFVANFTNGSVTKKLKRITQVTLHVLESHTWTVMDETQPVYDVTDDLSAPPAQRSGLFEYAGLGYDLLAQVTITQTAPLPFTLLGIEKEVRI